VIIPLISVSVDAGVQIGSATECESEVFGEIEVAEEMACGFDVGNDSPPQPVMILVGLSGS
jgi:hypothetical protein